MSVKAGESDLQYFHGTFGDSVHKGPAVLFCKNAVIEHHDNSFVGFSPNEPADALAKLQDGFRQGKLAKGVAAAGFDCFDTRLNQRMIWYCEWQARDDD